MSIIESVQQYDLNIPVGGAQSIDVEGDMVRFLSAVDPFAQIEIRPNFAQGNITLKPGQGFKFSERVKRWVVLNKGTVPLSGYLMIGSGDFSDQRISGDVNVIDGAMSRTLGDVAFVANLYASGLEGLIRNIQLWNPVGSGRNLIVQAIVASTADAGVLRIGGRQSALSSLSATVPLSKKIGGPAGVAQLRQQDGAASLIVGGNLLERTYQMGGGAADIKLSGPIVVGPGAGLVVVGPLSGNCTAWFEYYEETA